MKNIHRNLLDILEVVYNFVFTLNELFYMI